MKLTVPEVLPKAVALYLAPGGGAGCCLHVLLDDGNLDCSSWCYGWAEKKGHQECMGLALLLGEMTDTQRNKISQLAGSIAYRMQKDMISYEQACKLCRFRGYKKFPLASRDAFNLPHRYFWYHLSNSKPEGTP